MDDLGMTVEPVVEADISLQAAAAAESVEENIASVEESNAPSEWGDESAPETIA